MTEPAIQNRIAECGKAAAITCLKAMTTGPSVNLPTLVAACARMSGSYLLRSFDLDLASLTPGKAVLSRAASEKTPLLLRFCASMLQTLGAPVSEPAPDQLSGVESKIKQGFLETQRTLEPMLAPLRAQYALDEEQMAKALALATGALIHQFAKHMDPSAGFGYAAFGFTEGARTVPLHGDWGSNAT